MQERKYSWSNFGIYYNGSCRFPMGNWNGSKPIAFVYRVQKMGFLKVLYTQIEYLGVHQKVVVFDVERKSKEVAQNYS